MKNSIIKIFCVIVLFTGISCDEDEFLKETPLDFYSLDTSYKDLSQYDRALTALYGKVREIHFGGYDTKYFCYWLATDLVYNGRENNLYFGDYNSWLDPTNDMVAYHWDSWYKIVTNANTIIDRLPASDLSDSEKLMVEAEARFFRGLAYRYLVYLYGGVPLVLEEVSVPKSDFTRATKEEVFDQIEIDLSFAANNLPKISEVQDGKVSNLVANHYLAEIYLSINEFDNAINALNVVINDANTGLMTDRFGVKATEDPQDDFLDLGPGDPYWDLFRPGNQNRSGGNNEALWVAQLEVDIIGGGLSSTTSQLNQLEIWAGNASYGSAVQDPDGVQAMLGLPISGYNAGGRAYGLIRNTDYYLNDVWQSDWDNDIRNAPHNIVREVKYNNPNSAYYGLSALEEPNRSPTFDAVTWRWYPWPSKISTPGEHPEQLYQDRENNILLGSAGSTYRDMYYLRLPESYLLRAEAFFRKGELQNAADDINVVRERSNAAPITTTDVSIDYILDERARELVYEEFRRITLHRLGNLVERVRQYNPWNGDEIQDHHGLWPIPFSAIEANTNAVLEQNPGYPQ